MLIKITNESNMQLFSNFTGCQQLSSIVTSVFSLWYKCEHVNNSLITYFSQIIEHTEGDSITAEILATNDPRNPFYDSSYFNVIQANWPSIAHTWTTQVDVSSSVIQVWDACFSNPANDVAFWSNVDEICDNNVDDDKNC